ncbi:MAG: hypothetical protein MZV63_45105 [Marinilabiliales bacterium]|nr:hypothetical protein [Marinilabiliales bacterium]
MAFRMRMDAPIMTMTRMALSDERDKCPNDSEDKDGFQDDDGCPDFDNDNDGIPDSKDKCPNEAENFNGFEDDDGCPDILSNTMRCNG